MLNTNSKFLILMLMAQGQYQLSYRTPSV